MNESSSFCEPSSDDYITTAMPVGSRTISRKAGVGFSPATIRNEMSDLEELGIPCPAAYLCGARSIL